MRLLLVDTFGAVPVSRARARELRLTIQRSLADGENVVVDLEGISTLSPSFVDELFAKTAVAPSQAGKLTFENVPPSLEPLIRFLRSGRPKQTLAA